jgi:hypothetical protein
MSSSTTPNRRATLRIVVLGYLVRGPVGGMAWVTLHYLHGLRRLGHEVLFLEDSTDSPWCCYDPVRSVTDADPTFGLSYAAEVFEREGIRDLWAYWDAHTRRWFGPRAGDAEAWCRSADLLINISGITPLREWTAAIPRRALIDTDPVFTQIKHLTEPATRATAQQHNAFFTYGEFVGRPDCLIPDDGFPWRPMRQPVVLERWPFKPGKNGAPFTTVMQWNSYKAPEHNGRRFGMKSDTFPPYIDLPQRTSAPLQLALGGNDAPREQLRAAGWQIVNPLEVSWWPWDYRAYIQASAGEFGVAKHGYVASHSGAFSDRTAAFLASGRPVVVQDTGFSEVLPVGEGLCPFTTPEDAVDALESIVRDPARHQRAARAIAETHFDSDVVLSRVVEQAMS